jgi:hypothetical protein
MNRITDQTIDARVVFLFLIIGALTLAAGFLFTQTTTLMATAITIGVIVAVIAFVNTEAALYILIIAMLLGPQFTAGPEEAFVGRGRGGMTLRFDDFLLVVIGFSWFLKTAINKELGLFPATPLTRPIFWYFTVCLVATLFGYLYGRVRSIAGIFFVLKYFEYFLIYFMAVSHLKEKKADRAISVCHADRLLHRVPDRHLPDPRGGAGCPRPLRGNGASRTRWAAISF